MTFRILTYSNMSFIVEVFVVNVSKITTFNKNVLNSEWTFRLVAAGQQIRV